MFKISSLFTHKASNIQRTQNMAVVITTAVGQMLFEK